MEIGQGLELCPGFSPGGILEWGGGTRVKIGAEMGKIRRNGIGEVVNKASRHFIWGFPWYYCKKDLGGGGGFW